MLFPLQMEISLSAVEAAPAAAAAFKSPVLCRKKTSFFDHKNKKVENGCFCREN